MLDFFKKSRVWAGRVQFLKYAQGVCAQTEHGRMSPTCGAKKNIRNFKNKRNVCPNPNTKETKCCCKKNSLKDENIQKQGLAPVRFVYPIADSGRRNTPQLSETPSEN
ncbi:unnamed protein product [Polarella glacialis]|uniref:Uncharacterized protein n=1 Tax=Polarella glacialis TaxID=89957 RepID=A0A813FEJ9_POLGL|nr:unnamed protein product [Polarella glacialis]